MDKLSIYKPKSMNILPTKDAIEIDLTITQINDNVGGPT